MKSNKHITRAEALKKMGKYAALTATSTFLLLNPKTAAAQTVGTDTGDTSGSRPGSIWKWYKYIKPQCEAFFIFASKFINGFQSVKRKIFNMVSTK